MIESVVEKAFKLKIIGANQIKINTDTSEGYTLVIKKLDENNVKFHTY